MNEKERIELERLDQIQKSKILTDGLKLTVAENLLAKHLMLYLFTRLPQEITQRTLGEIMKELNLLPPIESEGFETAYYEYLNNEN